MDKNIVLMQSNGFINSKKWLVSVIEKEKQKKHLSVQQIENLRLLPTFAGVVWKKIRTCAGFNKILTNYISEESLINGVYDKSIVWAIFPFSKCKKAVRVKTTEVRSSEFIGYRIPQHKHNKCTQLFTKYQ